MKKHFNKNLIMIKEEEEEKFQKLVKLKRLAKNLKRVNFVGSVKNSITVTMKKLENLEAQLTGVVTVIFHNLRGCDSQLIFCELNKYNVKIDVIPDGLDRYMPFILNKILVFIDST